MPELPTGTVTFLLTDVEGATRLWEDHPDAMRATLPRHDAIFEDVARAHGGVPVRERGEGDSRFAVFRRATDGVAAVTAFQVALTREDEPIRVRAALHTGEADLRDDDYYGTTVNRCARLRGIAHGGQTLLSQATAELVRDALPEKATLRDLGEHRLRDLARPEHVYQLCHPDLPDEFSALASLEAVPNNLPVQATSFVGRGAEIAEVERLVGRIRLLTLTGAAGCGKTRLALHVAAEMLDRFPGGVWLIDLAPVPHPDLVTEETASSLGISPGGLGRDQETDTPALDRIIEHLRARDALILLDNCEHVVGACAELCDAILRSCAGVRILATSREPLGVAAETAWRVPSLPAPDPDAGVRADALEGFEAAALFLERARQARSGFAPTDEDARAIAQICARLDGIPLAIELAAARVKVLAPGQIASRLDDRFRFLIGGARTALERQQTLRAAVDWSHDMLSETERALLRRLCVFSGTFSVAAAEDVCAGTVVDPQAVVDLLQSLIDKSWLVMEEQGGEARYRLLETFRQYGREKLLESGEVGVVRTRHRDHFLVLVERLGRARGPDIGTVADLVYTDYDNVRGALEWSLAEEGGAEKTLRLVAPLRLIWWPTGMAGEGRRWTAAALEQSGEVAPAIRARALVTAGMLEAGTFDTARERRLYEEAIRLAAESGDLETELAARAGEAYLLFMTDLDATRRALDDILARARAHELLDSEWDALVGLAGVASVDGFPAARTLSDQALAIARRLGDQRRLSISRMMTAWLAFWQADYETADALFSEEPPRTFAVMVRAGGEYGRATVDWARGDLESARARLEGILDVIRRAGSAPSLASVLSGLAAANSRLGNLDVARNLAAEIRSLLVGAGDPSAIPRGVAHDLADVAIGEGDAEGALETCRAALRRPVRAAVDVALVLDLMSRAYGLAGRGDAVARASGAADALYDVAGAGRFPSSVSLLDDVQATARAAIGDEAYERAHAEGRAMSLEQAIAWGLVKR